MAIVVSPTSKAFSSTAAGADSASQAFSLAPDVTTDSIFAIEIVDDAEGNFVLTNTKYGVAPASGQYNYNQSTLLTSTDATAFSVVFHPKTTGAKKGTALVHYNGNGVASTLSVALTGTGT